MRPPRACRHLAVAAILAVLTLLPAGADSVRGYVIAATGGERLADVEIAFLMGGDAGLTEVTRKRTDGDGAFEFSGPFVTDGLAFALSAHYGELDYRSDLLRVGEQDQVIVEVYDGTEDPAALTISGHHLFFAVTPQGLDAAQLIQVENSGASTYVGRGPGTPRRVLEFAIPSGSRSLQGLDIELHRDGETRVFTTEPVPPGRSEITFTFQIDADDFDGDLVHEVLLPTRRLDIFLRPDDIALQGPGFEDLGPVSLHDTSYRHYRLTDLAPGRRVEISLPFRKPLRWALKWALVALVPITLLVAVGLARSSEDGVAESRPAAAADRVEARRQALVTALARLDDDLATAAGDAAADLRRRRARMKAELVDLYRRLGA